MQRYAVREILRRTIDARIGSSGFYERIVSDYNTHLQRHALEGVDGRMTNILARLVQSAQCSGFVMLTQIYRYQGYIRR